MDRIDRILENIRKEVELTGRSGADCVFKDNLQFSIEAKDSIAPLDCDVEGAIADVAWFLKCAKARMVIPHPNPDGSFWLRIFGRNARPYGETWNLEDLKENLASDEAWRRAMLFNYQDPKNPPCVTCYQFQSVTYGTLDCTVSIRSSDVAKILAQDVFMTKLILDYICGTTDYTRGKMTFNLTNAHVYYEDMEWPEENTIDFGN